MSEPERSRTPVAQEKEPEDQAPEQAKWVVDVASHRVVRIKRDRPALAVRR
jgi:hypothetical protein